MRATPPQRVLIIDDDRPTRALVEALLGDEGFIVDSVAVATEALSAIERQPPDVVLLDIMMPEISGFGLMAEIRDRVDVPIIFLSAKGGEADRVRGLRLGADDYIVKPFSNNDLIARIRALAGARRG
ncbi:MAG TPA: response regulator [Mycobacteriales bacterium]|jgi:two-component system OmpR family response regulator|nr:response regulator [Mycobacteriales bacterium]